MRLRCCEPLESVVFDARYRDDRILLLAVGVFSVVYILYAWFQSAGRVVIEGSSDGGS